MSKPVDWLRRRAKKRTVFGGGRRAVQTNIQGGQKGYINEHAVEGKAGQFFLRAKVKGTLKGARDVGDATITPGEIWVRV